MRSVAKNLEISFLLDFYGDMLTDKQRDVVELYYTAPYTNGGIEKASVNLIDFEKTALLEPGKSETVTLTVALEDMASYDSSCLKTANGGYILEAGTYNLSIRSDSHTVLDSKDFEISLVGLYLATEIASIALEVSLVMAKSVWTAVTVS